MYEYEDGLNLSTGIFHFYICIFIKEKALLGKKIYCKVQIQFKI